ncbi:GntR family transcriptional regulator [Streptomyces cyaneofuscatus]|uniref:GntR family transcriptional regulator n=1 Tax=Streptomyces cyaneofuscatus TaxID=66883 RepID=UPI0036A3AFE9
MCPGSRYSEERARQVAEDLRIRIARGTWQHGQVLTYRDLQDRYKTGRDIVSAALRELRELGLVETRRAGTRPRITGKSWTTAPHGSSMQDHITSSMRARITNGTYLPGDQIPSRAALAGEFGVSIATVRRALLPLADEGLLASEGGRSGTYVRGQH